MDCIICTDEVTTEYKINKPCACKYIIHENCYIEWKNINPTKACLMCRQIVIPLPSAPPAEEVVIIPIHPIQPEVVLVQIEPQAPLPSAPPETNIVPVYRTLTHNHWRSANPFEVLGLNNDVNLTLTELYNTYTYLVNLYSSNHQIREEAIFNIYTAYRTIAQNIEFAAQYENGNINNRALQTYLRVVRNNQFNDNTHIIFNSRRKRRILIGLFILSIISIIVLTIVFKIK